SAPGVPGCEPLAGNQRSVRPRRRRGRPSECLCPGAVPGQAFASPDLRETWRPSGEPRSSRDPSLGLRAHDAIEPDSFETVGEDVPVVTLQHTTASLLGTRQGRSWLTQTVQERPGKL